MTKKRSPPNGTSTVPLRAFIGYMAFNHATGAVTLATSYNPNARVPQRGIYSTPPKYEATIFKTEAAALRWINRTIRTGRTEWTRRRKAGDVSSGWQDSDWKWLHRQTWSVVPVFQALGSEHV